MLFPRIVIIWCEEQAVILSLSHILVPEIIGTELYVWYAPLHLSAVTICLHFLGYQQYNLQLSL